MSTTLLAAAVLPVIGLCYYIYAKDTNREPFKVLAKLFGIGVLSCFPASILENLVDVNLEDKSIGFVAMFISVFIGVGIIEEGVKWVTTKFFGYNSVEFDEIYDIMVYSVFASLGFACLENILYVISGGLGTAILRALLSVPGHACFGVLMGYFFAQAKLASEKGDNGRKILMMILSILVPSFFHTMYDALAFLEEMLFFLGFDIIMVVICFVIVNKMAKMQVRLKTNKAAFNPNMPYNNQMYYGQGYNAQGYNNQYYNTPVFNQQPTTNNNMPVNNGQQNVQTSVPTNDTQSNVQNNYCPMCGKQVSGNYCSGCGYKIK